MRPPDQIWFALDVSAALGQRDLPRLILADTVWSELTRGVRQIGGWR